MGAYPSSPKGAFGNVNIPIIKIISFIILSLMFVYVAFVSFKTKDNLDKKILDVPLSETLSVIGFRNNKGNATTSYSYNFYVYSQGSELSEPFIISNTSNVTIKTTGAYSFSVNITGNIYQFTNVVWVNENNNLVPINVELNAKNNFILQE